MPRVENSRAPSMPSKTSDGVGGLTAGTGDVASSTPSISAMSRSFSAASGMSIHPLAPKLKFTRVCMAWPSSDGSGPMTSPSTPSMVANSLACSVGSGDVVLGQPGLALVDDDGRDRVGVLERRRAPRAPWVDSALAGSHEDASLFCTSVSFGAKAAATHQRDDPEDEDEPLGHPAGQPAGDLCDACWRFHH